MNEIEFGKRLMYEAHFDLKKNKKAMEKQLKITNRIVKLQNEFKKINGVTLGTVDHKMYYQGKEIIIPIIEYKLTKESSLLLSPIFAGIVLSDDSRATMKWIGNVSGVPNKRKFGKKYRRLNSKELLEAIIEYMNNEFADYNIKLNDERKKELHRILSLIEITYNTRKKLLVA